VDEHIVSMMWLYSNVVGGVKALVPDERSEEAESLLTTHAGMDGPTPSVSGAMPIVGMAISASAAAARSSNRN
jgi:hypothetical protein